MKHRLSTHTNAPAQWVAAAAVILIAACGSGADGAADADPNAADADPDAPDADPNAPDANPNAPDSNTGPLAGWCSGQPDDFSFFVTSMSALWTLAGDPVSDLSGGFGGNFGGISGADDICQTIAAATGHGDKTWRAFLSATNDGSGNPVHAIDRIGSGPWYDANGRQVATGISGLLSADRPDGDAQSTEDLPDECGVPTSVLGDAHDVVTASDENGQLFSTNLASTCNDWTSDSGGVGSGNVLICGHSFPRGSGGPGGMSGQKWLSDHPLRGCDKGANLIQNGPGTGTSIGASGGYGAIYCFAL